MKNLGALKTAGSKIFSLPVLAEKTLGVIGLGKKTMAQAEMQWMYHMVVRE